MQLLFYNSLQVNLQHPTKNAIFAKEKEQITIET